MGFFTSDFKLAEETADPKVSQSYQPTAAVSPLSASRAVTGDPLSQFAQQLSGGGGGTSGYGWGADTNNSLTGTGALSNSMISGFTPGTGGFGFPEPSTNPITERGANTLTGYASSEGDGDITDNTTIDSYQSLQDYLNASPMEREVASGLLGMMGIPFGGSLMKIGMGINPLGDLTGEANQTFDWYKGGTTYFGAPISDAQAATASGGMFSGFGSQYEADVAEMYGELSDERMTAIEQQFAELNKTQPAPVPPTQEYVIEDPKDMQVDNIAGGYTWDSGLGTTEEMQEETGLGTSEWDTSHSDFSWGDSSDAGDGTTDASDDPGGDDDDAGGWSFSDDDSGGGDSGGGDSGGGGGSYIATAATQALGEEGLTIFENWRDYMFDALPTFTTSYGRYRVTAPKIVAEINKKDNSKEIYSWIWDMHLKPIFDMITEDRDSTKALKDYKIMVRELQNKFLSKEKG